MLKNSLVHGLPVLVWAARSYGWRARAGSGQVEEGRRG